MNSARWTLFAVGYQCCFAYAVSLMIYQFGMLFAGDGNVPGVIAALILLGLMGYMIFKPHGQTGKLEKLQNNRRKENA